MSSAFVLVFASLHVPIFVRQRRSQFEHLYLNSLEIWANYVDVLAGRAQGQGSAGAGPVRDVDVLEDMYRSTMEQVTILVSLLLQADCTRARERMQWFRLSRPCHESFSVPMSAPVCCVPCVEANYVYM